MTSHSHWLMKFSRWDSFTCVGTKLKQHSKKRFLGRGFHSVKPHRIIVTRSANDKTAADGILQADAESYASSANRT